MQAVSSSAVRSWKMSLWQTVASLQFLRRCTLMRYTYFHSCLLKEVKLEKNLSIAIFHIYSCFVVLRGGGVRTGRISLTKQFPYKCFNICLVFLSFFHLQTESFLEGCDFPPAECTGQLSANKFMSNLKTKSGIALTWNYKLNTAFMEVIVGKSYQKGSIQA